MKIFFIIFFYVNMSSFLYSDINAIVSIEPQKVILDAIAKDKVKSISIIKSNISMHNFKLKPSMMKKILKSDIYFSLDLGFEKVWLSKFSKQNSNMLIVNMSHNIVKIPSLGHGHHHDEDENLDPHIWTSLFNAKIMAKNVLEGLIKFDNNNIKFYRNNYNSLIKKIDRIDEQIKQILKNKNNKFLIVHPSWGYFAKDYNLKQIALEIEGKSPKISQLHKLMKKIKKDKIKTIFIQKAFSSKMARQIAKELNLKLVHINNLDKNYFQNLIKFSKEIAK